jgi:hypothetical protein
VIQNVRPVSWNKPFKVRGGSLNMPVKPNSSSKVPHKSSIFLSNAIRFPICKGGTRRFQVLQISKLWK